MLDRDHSCGSALPGWGARRYGTPPLSKSHSYEPQARGQPIKHTQPSRAPARSALLTNIGNTSLAERLAPCGGSSLARRRRAAARGHRRAPPPRRMHEHSSRPRLAAAH